MGCALITWVHVAALALWERRRERSGQGTVEYVGIVVMVTLLIAALATLSSKWAPDLGSALKKAITTAINEVTDGLK